MLIQMQITIKLSVFLFKTTCMDLEIPSDTDFVPLLVRERTIQLQKGVSDNILLVTNASFLIEYEKIYGTH